MRELTDEDAERIITIVDRVREKHMDGSTVTAEKLSHLHKELTGRLEDAGYLAIVDVTPLFVGMPPTVSIEGRSEGSQDIERKLWDIKKRQELNEDAPDIEGFV